MRYFILIVLMLSIGCGRPRYKPELPVYLDKEKCDTYNMMDPDALLGGWYIENEDAQKIIVAYRDCLHYTEGAVISNIKIALLNHKAAELNKPDGIGEDSQEFGFGYIAGLITAAILILF